MMWEASEKDLFATPAPVARTAGPRDVTGELTVDDLDQDRTLRPRTLDEYIGQERVRENLRVLIQAARDRGESLDHVIFSGPPGPRQDHARGHRGQRDGRQDAHHLRPRDRARRRPRCHPHQPRGGRRPLRWTRSIASTTRSRRSSTRRWRTSSWTSSSARARRRARFASTCRTSRSWAPPRAPAFSPAPCATALASRIGWTTTPPPSSPSSWTARPASSAWG